MKRLPLLAVALTLVLPACAARRPRPVRPPPAGSSSTKVPKMPQAPLKEESLNSLPPAPQAHPQVEPPAAPQPETMLAGITPQTPPQVATSIRLTDEGRQLLSRGDLKNALDRLEKALRIDPTNAYGYYWLAQVHYRRERYDQAIAFADKAAVLFSRTNPGWQSQTYTFKGTVCEKIGNFPAARDAYRKALSIQAGNADARAGLSRVGDSTGPRSP